jgi:Flp pilus assembly protein TadD
LAHNNLGIALTRQGKLVEAADSFRKACTLDPKYKDAFVNLGALLAVQGKSDEAVDALLKAVAVDPKDGEIHNKLAVLYFRKGDSAKAREHARQARALGAAVDPVLAEELAKIR